MDMEAEMLAIRVMHLFFHQTDVVLIACRDRKYLGSFWQLTYELQSSETVIKGFVT